MSTPNVTSGCLAPPQPANGEWKLDVCQERNQCRVPEGTVLQAGSQLVYSCASGFKAKGPTDIYCRLSGRWSAIPTCHGDTCSTRNGSSGICTLLKSCPPALRGLKARRGPENTCGFAGIEPIVCCPITTRAVPEDLVGDGRGEIARQRCTEYSQSVNTSICPPFKTDAEQPVTLSIGTGKVKASPMEFPHMVAVGFNLKDGSIGWLCGGTLISDTFVITAAACTNSKTIGNPIWARVGESNLKRTDDGAAPLDRRIAERIVHPEYKAPLAYHDIALLRLESPVPFNDWIRPACLYTAPSVGTPEAIATGWGSVRIADFVGLSDDLMKVTLPLVDEETCRSSFITSPDGKDRRLPNGVVVDWVICAGAFDRDTCQGDSGGPLVIYSKKGRCTYDLIGITSIGRACGDGIPRLYTRVYNYISWIESVVWPRG